MPRQRLTPLQAIRKTCLLCQGGSRKLVAECPDDICPLYPYRFGKMPTDPTLSIRTSIRKFCLRCAGSAPDANACKGGTQVSSTSMPTCDLHPFRTGRKLAPKKKAQPVKSVPPKKDTDRKERELSLPIYS